MEEKEPGDSASGNASSLSNWHVLGNLNKGPRRYAPHTRHPTEKTGTVPLNEDFRSKEMQGRKPSLCHGDAYT